MKRWYVVRTHAQGEQKALFHLRRQGFTAYLPRYLRRRRHARCTDWAPAPLSPRYLFVELDTEINQWRPIRSTVGVSQLVCNGERPAPVPVDVVEGMIEREDDDGMVMMNVLSPFKKGARVQILAGALCDQVGIFDCSDDKERVVVLLNLLGREVKVRLPMEAVTAHM